MNKESELYLKDLENKYYKLMEENKKLKQDCLDFVELGTDQFITEKITRLEAENKGLRQTQRHERTRVVHWEGQIKKLKACVEFYGNNSDVLQSYIMDHSDEEDCEYLEYYFKQARQCLEELKTLNQGENNE